MASLGTSYIKKIPSKNTRNQSSQNKSMATHRHRSSYSDLTKLNGTMKFAASKEVPQPLMNKPKRYLLNSRKKTSELNRL